MGLFSSDKSKPLGVQPRRDLPWTLNVNGTASTPAWPDIAQALDRLGPNSETFVILEQRQGKDDYWYIQSAVALAGPHTGEYIVGCGWSGPEGPVLLEWYGSYPEAVEFFRAVWEGRPLDFSGFADLSHTLPANQRKSRLAIACLTVGEIGTNCYFVTDRQEKATAVIDPGGDGARIIAELKKRDARLQYILLTHGHYDHTDAVPELAAAFPEAEIYIHPKDYPGPSGQLFPLYGQLGDCPAIRFYKAFNDRDVPPAEAEELPLGGLRIHPIHTPGHSEGSVSLRVSGGPIFCGDALFAGSCGRTDFPGGDVEKMMSTLRLFGTMKEDAQIFPGHMSFTTLEEEQKHNPYLRQAMNGGF